MRRPPTTELHPHSVKSGHLAKCNSGFTNFTQIVRNPKVREVISRGPSQELAKPQAIINEETLTALKDEIGYLWEIYKVDKHYREAFLGVLSKLPITFFVECLAREIDALYKEKATIQKLYLAIKKREELLAQIEKLNEHIKTMSLSPQVMENAVKLLESLRLATLAAIELGLHLRAELRKLSQTTGNKLPIIYNEQDYFEKIVADTKYINESEIGKLFKLGRKIDVFFMAASQPIPLLQKPKQISKRSTFQGGLARNNPKSLSLVLTIPIGGLYKRMKAAEMALTREASKAIEELELKYASNREEYKGKAESDM